jgi:inner membrane protein
MTAPTHVTFGALSYFVVAAIAQWQPSTAAVATAALGSLLPDIDLPTSAAGRPLFPIAKALNEQIGHRTLTHSLVGIFLLLLILSPLFFIDSLILWALLIGYVSHLLIDTTNKAGIELLYPSRLRAWFLNDERYRITVGSREEFVLLVVLLVFTIAFFPVTIRGFTGTLHYLLGDTESAVTDFYRHMPTHSVIATVAAIDTISQEEVRGDFPVLGANGNNALIIKHDDRLREVGPSGHLRPERVRIKPGAPHKLVEQQIEMGGHILREIEPFVKGQDVHLFGSLHVITDKNPVVRVDAFNPIRRSGSTLILEHATYDDLIAQGFDLTPVEQGTLIIKTALPPDAAVRPVSLTSPHATIAVFSVKLKDLADLAVGPGATIAKGDVLLRDRAAARELEALTAEIASEQEQWERRQRLAATELDDLRTKIALAEAALRRLTDRQAVYTRSPELFAKELKRLDEEISAQENTLLALRSDLAQRETRWQVEELQYQDKLRALAGRQAKLETEAVVFATVGGTVVGMETEYGAEHITVKLAVATVKPEEQERESGRMEEGHAQDR